MLDDTIIISMTSWPKRIHLVAPAVYSIYRQISGPVNCRIVVVLAKPEFPNLEADLPFELRTMINAKIVDLLWCDENLYSHKKLMPTILKWPNNTILCVDDDVIRPNGWYTQFLNDHNKYPNDIIVGCCWYDIGYENGRFNPTKAVISDSGVRAGSIITNSRPANGYGGILYPAHTFTDSRFFDLDLMMHLSARSDECWQYCFNIIEDKTLRWLSYVWPYHKYIQDGSQETSMGQSRILGKISSYDEIHTNLFKAFPEFERKLKLKLGM